MKRTVVELIKNIVIVVLLCTMVLLLVASLPAAQIRQMPFLSRLLQPLAPLLGLPQAELAYVETALPVTDAAEPVAISVNNGGGRRTVMWDAEQLDRTFEALGGILGQALDTAHTGDQAEMHQVTRALSGISVCYSYAGSLPADMLAIWLDATLDEAIRLDVSSFVLAVEDGETVLYLVGDRILRTSTEVSAETLDALLSDFTPDGSAFAYETEADLSPLSLLPGSDRTVSAVTRSNPINNRRLEQLATDLGFNPYGDASYTDASGDTYFTETGSVLQISAAGRLTLTSTGSQRFRAADEQPNTLAEEARRLVTLAAGDALGDARLYLTEMNRLEDRTIFSFACMINGIPVDQTGAYVVFTGAAVTSLELQLTSYTVRSQTLQVLPPIQAAAILPSGADLRLMYSDTGVRQLTAGWSKG